MTTLSVKEAEVLQCTHKHKRHNIKDLHRLNEFIILLHFAGKPCVLTFLWILVRNVTHQCVPQHWKNCSRSTRRKELTWLPKTLYPNLIEHPRNEVEPLRPHSRELGRHPPIIVYSHIRNNVIQTKHTNKMDAPDAYKKLFWYNEISLRHRQWCFHSVTNVIANTDTLWHTKTSAHSHHFTHCFPGVRSIC